MGDRVSHRALDIDDELAVGSRDGHVKAVAVSMPTLARVERDREDQPAVAGVEDAAPFVPRTQCSERSPDKVLCAQRVSRSLRGASSVEAHSDGRIGDIIDRLSNTNHRLDAARAADRSAGLFGARQQRDGPPQYQQDGPHDVAQHTRGLADSPRAPLRERSARYPRTRLPHHAPRRSEGTGPAVDDP